MRGEIFGIALALCCATTALGAADQEQWRIERLDGVIIRTRNLSGGVTEFIAEGTLDASVQDIEDVLTRVELHPRFMPYVKESRVVGRGTDGGRLVYVLLDFPFFFKSHDYVINVHVDQSSRRTNEFRSHWSTETDVVPEKDDVVRVPLNEGEWVVTGEGPGRSHVLYRYAVNPGDKVPSWAEDFGRKDGVLKLFRRIQAEASDRAFRRHYYGRDAAKSARR
ncbi:MAG: SRPBCC family protein [Myxococcaceae bacterium]